MWSLLKIKQFVGRNFDIKRKKKQSFGRKINQETKII